MTQRPSPERVEEIRNSDCFSTIIKRELEAEIDALKEQMKWRLGGAAVEVIALTKERDQLKTELEKSGRSYHGTVTGTQQVDTDDSKSAHLNFNYEDDDERVAKSQDAFGESWRYIAVLKYNNRQLKKELDQLKAENEELLLHNDIHGCGIASVTKERDQLKLERDTWERNYNAEVEKCGKYMAENLRFSEAHEVAQHYKTQLAQSEKKREKLREEADRIIKNPTYTSQLAITAWNKALAEDENVLMSCPD